VAGLCSNLPDWPYMFAEMEGLAVQISTLMERAMISETAGTKLDGTNAYMVSILLLGPTTLSPIKTSRPEKQPGRRPQISPKLRNRPKGASDACGLLVLLLSAFAVPSFADDAAPDKSDYTLFNPTPRLTGAASIPIGRRRPTAPIPWTPANSNTRPTSSCLATATQTASRPRIGQCSIRR